jgi:predicted metal-dependent peptidase
MNALTKLTAARTALILDQPFFGALALGLKLVEDPGCETAWTNGRDFGYDPAFIDSLSLDEAIGLTAHEVSHCAQGHPWRRDTRDIKQWNEACDKAINHDLKEAGFKLPADGLYATGDEIGKSAEWIYARAQQKPKGQGGKQPKPGQGPGQGQGQQPGGGNGQPDPNAKPQPNKLGEVRDAPKQADASGTPVPTEQDWKQKVQQAAATAKACGNMPAGAKLIAKEALRPRIDTKSVLLRFFQDRSAGDYTWSRPSPRYISQGLYLPVLESKALGEVAILCDTSGSMDAVALQHARGIVEQVIDECNPSKVTLYMVDTKVHNVREMERGEPLTWEPKGGGGTSFVSFFRDIEESGEQPVCIVGITDLQASFPDTVPSIPVVWITDQQNGTAPFGEVVPLDE